MEAANDIGVYISFVVDKYSDMVCRNEKIVYMYSVFCCYLSCSMF